MMFTEINPLDSPVIVLTRNVIVYFNFELITLEKLEFIHAIGRYKLFVKKS